MEKAYDVKVLVAKLKVRGLDVGEDAALGILDDVTAWVEESAPLSKNPIDDVLVIALPAVKKEAKKHLDKIDGKEG